MGNQTILLFGATGDLAKKKLLPALFTLYRKKHLVDTPILALGRRSLTKEQFIEESGIKELEKKDHSHYHIFLNNLTYLAIDLDDKHPIEFINTLEHLDKKHGCKDHLCYLAISAELFNKTLNFLDRAKVFNKNTKLAFEKPFGFDQKSSRQLQKNVLKFLSEEQIYRVDHYLGKSMVENLLTIRQNPLFSSLWNSKYIDNVQIVALENFGVEGRGEYYDKAGAIKDFVQNHLLQLLALVAMEIPSKPNPEAIRSEKTKVIKKLQIPSSLVLGQYDGYLADVNLKGSSTETFIAFKTQLNNSRWRKVPFYIKTGKYLKKKYSEINLVLKKEASQAQNVISIRLGPEQEGIAILASTKENNVQKPITFEYCHKCEFGPNTSEAYERLITEIIASNQTLFTRADELDASWKFTDALIKKAKKVKLHTYHKGSEGPKEAETLLTKEQREWVYFDRKITI